jgi:hypothetical protein
MTSDATGEDKLRKTYSDLRTRLIAERDREEARIAESRGIHVEPDGGIFNLPNDVEHPAVLWRHARDHASGIFGPILSFGTRHLGASPLAIG